MVSTADTHGGFLGDGEYHLILRVPPETITGLLNRNPTAPLPVCEPGPVPTEIGSRCRFGFDQISIQSIGGGPMEYRGDNELVEVLTSDQIYYTAHQRCCENLAWHNGTLVILDPQSDTVWISIWDF